MLISPRSCCVCIPSKSESAAAARAAATAGSVAAAARRELRGALLTFVGNADGADANTDDEPNGAALRDATLKPRGRRVDSTALGFAAAAAAAVAGSAEGQQRSTTA